MGSLRRTGTISVIETVQEIKPSLQLFDADFGICRISFQYDIAAIPGMPHLRFSFNSKGNPKAGSSEDINQIKAVLNQVRSCGVDFVTTFDFREQQRPNMRLLAPALATFSDKKSKTWAGGSQAVALLTAGNIFANVANGAIASFVEVSGLHVSPLVMCHQDNIAADFFKEVVYNNASKSCPSSFVSVKGLKDLGSSGCYSCLCPWNPSRQSNAGKGHDAGGKEQASVEAPRMAMHTLDNGDVRVVQSPPSDLMVVRRQLTTLGITSTAANSKEASTTGSQQKSTGDGERNANAIEGVFFKCTSRTIKSLLGISFHICEMMIDADSESCFQRGEKIVASSNTRGSGKCPGRPQGCPVVPAPKAWTYNKGLGCFSGARLVYAMICYGD